MKKSTITWIVSLVIVFFMGVAFGMPSDKQEAPQCEESNCEEQLNAYKATVSDLVDLDDQAFGYAADGFGLCSSILTSAADGDINAVSEKADQMLELADDVTSLQKQRIQILKKLGFGGDEL